MSEDNNKQKKRKKKKKLKIVLLILELLILTVVLFGVWMWKQLSLDEIQIDPPMTNSEAGVNLDLEETTMQVLDGYTNIALFGLDNRGSNKYDTGNSDSIIIASINHRTKEVRLVSVYRDTYLKVGEDKFRKINSAYMLGGVRNAVRSLNENLDLDIFAYVCVDWKALVEAIDALGGVEIDIQQNEIKHLNGYIDETSKMAGVEPIRVTEPGLQLLNGSQATSYSRIRYTAGDDYMRTTRQRIVLQEMMKKAKQADFATLTELCNKVFDDIQTSLTLKDILYLAKDVASYEIASTTGFPFDLTNKSMKYCGDSVIPLELVDNVENLHMYLFEETDYVPSATVADISNEIVNRTALRRDDLKVDTSKFNETVGATGTGDVRDKQTEQQ